MAWASSRVLVAVDGGPGDDAVLEATRAHLDRHGGRVVVADVRPVATHRSGRRRRRGPAERGVARLQGHSVGPAIAAHGAVDDPAGVARLLAEPGLLVVASPFGRPAGASEGTARRRLVEGCLRGGRPTLLLPDGVPFAGSAERSTVLLAASAPLFAQAAHLARAEADLGGDPLWAVRAVPPGALPASELYSQAGAELHRDLEAAGLTSYPRLDELVAVGDEVTVLDRFAHHARLLVLSVEVARNTVGEHDTGTALSTRLSRTTCPVLAVPVAPEHPDIGTGEAEQARQVRWTRSAIAVRQQMQHMWTTHL